MADPDGSRSLVPRAPTRFVAFDLETTGLEKDKARIVEYCFIELDSELEELGRWTGRLNPGVPIPPEATDVHGIRDEDVAHEPTFDAIAPRAQRLVDQAILIAYHHEFDRDVLHYELVRHGQSGIAATHPFIDPYRIFRERYPHTLEGAVRLYADREHEGAHGAEADVTATVEVLQAQRDRHAPGAALSDLVFRDDVDWLDRDKRIYRDEADVIRFSFGKHRDEPVLDHLDYVEWIMKRGFPADTRRVLGELLTAHQQS